METARHDQSVDEDNKSQDRVNMMTDSQDPLMEAMPTERKEIESGMVKIEEEPKSRLDRSPDELIKVRDSQDYD